MGSLNVYKFGLWAVVHAGEKDGHDQYEKGGEPEGHHPPPTQPRAADGTEVHQQSMGG